ncbi:hypothetical protein [Algoriphagus sp. AK58]|uniref:hypothetical protein n=1 Tax=Algoriphagus sp. AK58 TaxID=1406877 RepID=UPI001650B7F2|nr:hypothetical protein [Algoriphagus sp. AK58]MBC6368013.1 hypothetical protein [Algoriphagus sp. AK58]
MEPTVAEKIKSYISAISRNRIVFHQTIISDLEYVDLGKELSKAIFNQMNQTKLSMRALVELEKILEKGVKNHYKYGTCLAICNLGILFEPELKLDFSGFLDKYSKNNVLFVKWEGEADSDHLYFLTIQNGIKISIKNISHIKI